MPLTVIARMHARLKSTSSGRDRVAVHHRVAVSIFDPLVMIGARMQSAVWIFQAVGRRDLS